MCLSGLPPDRWVTVTCTHCARSGRSRVARLLEQYGPDIPELDLLRILTRTCPHQHDPGSGKRRKYVPACLATIALPVSPRAISSGPPVPPGTPYTVEVWAVAGGGIELHLGTIYPLSMAMAAFEVACALWPDREVTVRDRCRIVRRRERPSPEP